MTLTQDRLKELLLYDPLVGEFSRRVRSSHNASAGTVTPQGYRQISVDGLLHYGHRLAFLYMTGEMPKGLVDHINGCRSDNRWSNLRLAVNGINQQNLRSPQRNNRTGLLGVSYEPCYRLPYVAQLTVDYKRVHLSRHATAEEAHAAYLEAKRKYHEGNTL